MDQHRQIFNQLLLAFGYSAKEVSAKAGINESRLSRFRTGKLDLEAGEFFRLLECFPEEFQEQFWARLRHVNGGWRALILSASDDDIGEILHFLAARWPVIKDHQPSESSNRDSAALAL